MTATVVYVAYGITSLDLGWIPESLPVVVVHNDDLLAPLGTDDNAVIDLFPGRNVGFGAGVNLALEAVDTDRIVLVNPDTVLKPGHLEALLDAPADELVTIPLREASGRPNAVVNRYWSAAAFLGSALRLGRFMPRESRRRRAVTRLLGSWGAAHREAVAESPGCWPLSERWASGAVLSLPGAALKAVGGFDPDYFLYYEDADLQQRLAHHDASLQLRLADVEPGVHEVGGSASNPHQIHAAAQARRRSAQRYASRQPGARWRVAERMVS